MSFYDIILSRNKENGNYYKARKDIPQFQLVFSEKFLLATPSFIPLKDGNRLCNVSRCGNWRCWKKVDDASGIICRCRGIIYCSKKCQEKNASIHSKMCNIGIMIPTLSLGTLYLVSNMDMILDLFPDGKLEKDDALKTVLSYVSLVDKFLNQNGQRYDRNTIFRVIRKIHFLSIHMKTFIGGYHYGQALFHFANYFNHSCNPNCFYYFCGREIRIKTLRDIKAGEELTIPYNYEIIYASLSVRYVFFLVFFSIYNKTQKE
jgi:hypothetical protein